MSGGAALVAATAIVGQLTPALGALLFGGAAISGGSMIAQNMCLGEEFLKMIHLIIIFY